MDNGYYNSDSPNVTVKVHMHQFAFENMPAKKSAKVNVLKKRKSPPRGEAPTSDEDIDVCTAINNNKANADEEVTKSNDDSALNQSGLNPAGVRKEDQFQDRTQRSREGNLNAIIPEPDTDEYLVEADDKVKHVYQGHLHSCQHADDCSDEAHSSGEEEPVDEWVKESDDEGKSSVKIQTIRKKVNYLKMNRICFATYAAKVGPSTISPKNSEWMFHRSLTGSTQNGLTLKMATFDFVSGTAQRSKRTGFCSGGQNCGMQGILRHHFFQQI